ncbi:MAG: transcriptional repressor [Lachnospiraceae bacterium]|nr:transcriptional repressor [Lachnospiraceae bacterium]
MKKVILEQLREQGCRITKQRELLVDIILKERCNNCKEIYYLAAKQDPNIGMATVYRMMNTLEEIGALKWRNEYRICEQEGSPKHCLVEFQDSSSMELKQEILHEILERGLEARGYLKGRRVKRVMIQRSECAE